MSSSWFLRALCLVCVLATLPGTFEFLFVTLGLVWPRRQRHRARRPVQRVSVVVPAHNEELLIGRCVGSFREQVTAVTYEVVVVADNCTDLTALRAKEAGARVLVRKDPSQRGKGFALRFAFDTLQDEEFDAVLIVDADSVASNNIVEEIASLIASGAEAVQCRYRVLKPESSLRSRLFDVAWLAFNVLRPMGRGRFGVSVGLLGNGFALSRACVRKIPYVAESVVEDLEYHLMLVEAGISVEFGNGATVFASIPDAGQAAETQRSRWEGGRLRMARERVPGLLVSVLRGRSALLEPLLELLSLPLAFHTAILSLILLLPVAAGRAYAAVALLVVVAHVLAAVSLGEDFWTSVGALATAPLYVAWKVAMIPAVLRNSRRSSSWARTERKAESVP